MIHELDTFATNHPAITVLAIILAAMIFYDSVQAICSVIKRKGGS